MVKTVLAVGDQYPVSDADPDCLALGDSLCFIFLSVVIRVPYYSLARDGLLEVRVAHLHDYGQ